MRERIRAACPCCIVGWANSPAAALMVGNGAVANLRTNCAEITRRCPPYGALACRRSPDGAKRNPGAASPYRTAAPALRCAPCGLREFFTATAVRNSRFSLTMFPPRSNQHVSRLDLRRLPETSRGRRRERLPRAVLQTALGRPPGTTTRMMSERPRGAPQGECPDRKGHGDASQASFGVSRKHAKVRPIARPHERLFRRSAPSIEGDEEGGATRCAAGRKSDPRD
jgi:hypothetical protein